MACNAAGHGVEYVDIDPATLEIGLRQCIDRIEHGAGPYSALIFVRPYGAILGRRVAFAELRKAAPGLLLVDDRCLCPPERPHEVDATGADLVLFSTGAKKHVDLGSRGYGVMASGIKYDDPHSEPLSSAAEAECYFNLIAKKLPVITEEKHRINAIYQKGIPPEACLPDAYQGWRFNILVNEAGILIQNLFDAGLFASRHYSDLTTPGALDAQTNAGRIAAHIVNLFNDHYYTEEQAERTVTIVREHLSLVGSPSWVSAISGGE